ncbi:hypothetical protein JVU11DRAFT_9923 [Chiua virens]|nr:hypothetical protein JVU11DRAFT_9923 [Chiua virens]
MTVPHSSRLTSFKDYISHRETRLSLPSRRAFPLGEDGSSSGRSTIHNLGKWAGQKMRRSATDTTTIEEVHLFPGWATKRPPPFDVEFLVSGFATSRRSPEFLTHSQRAFLKLARSFVSIPKPHPLPPLDPDLPGAFEGLQLPPRPFEIPDDYDLENLDAQFRNSGNYNQKIDDIPFTQFTQVEPIPAELVRLHENLESRLKPFWASSLSSRRVQVSVFVQLHESKHFQHSLESQPLLTREVLTGSDGYFSSTFKINWQDICTDPIGTHITSNHPHVEHELLLQARIINPERTPELHETPTSSMQMPITRSIVRVISDIDDTVRVSRVLDGARAIFNQVFVKDLEHSLIPEMGAWYDTLVECGVRFHYVSNSPYELLPLINQLINISKLPPGSIRLRSYAGRSLFNGLLSAPATRKRANVVEVLDHFPESQFFLVGDSGEQDLELYASLAAELKQRSEDDRLHKQLTTAYTAETRGLGYRGLRSGAPRRDPHSSTQQAGDRSLDVILLRVARPKDFVSGFGGLVEFHRLDGFVIVLEHTLDDAPSAAYYGRRKKAMGFTKPGEQGAAGDAVSCCAEGIRGSEGVYGGGADCAAAHGCELRATPFGYVGHSQWAQDTELCEVLSAALRPL